MRRFRLVLLWATFLVLAFPVCADELDVEKLAKETAKLLDFESDCGLTYWSVFEKIDDAVPKESRANVLARTWEIATEQGTHHRVIGNLANYLCRDGSNAATWGKRLELVIWKATKSADKYFRGAALGVLVDKKPAESRGLLLASLADPEDRIREYAVEQIAEWKDGEEFLELYVEDNNSKKEPDKSVARLCRNWLGFWQ